MNMTRRIFTFTLLASLTLPVGAYSTERNSLKTAIEARYTPSHMEFPTTGPAGRVSKPGTILVLTADGVAAKKLRVNQLNTKSPRFHVRDYAIVTVAGDGVEVTEPGDVTLPRGTRVVVVDVKTDSKGVRLFTHTLDRVADGGYGCTELRFPLDSGTADAASVFRAIDHVLTREGAPVDKG